MKQSMHAAILAASALVFAGVCATAQAPAEAPVTTTVQVPLADQPTDAQIAKLFEVMRVKDQLASMTKVMPQIMQQQFGEQMKQMQQAHPEMARMTPEQQQAISNIMSKFMKRAIAAATSDEMLSDMASLYKRHLTGADVDGAIAFYSSPAGAHFLDMIPAIMQELMPTVMHRTQEQIRPMIEEMSNEMMQVMAPAGTDTAKPAQK